MSITLEVDEQALRSLPLQPGERERDMKIELACRYYAKGWLSFGQAVRLAGLNHSTVAAELAERGIPSNLTREDVDRLPEKLAELGEMIPAPFDLPLAEPEVPVAARRVAEFLPSSFELSKPDLAPE